MSNIKKVSILATLLLIIGGIGIMFTYKSAFGDENISTKSETVNDEIHNLHIEIDNGSVEVLPTDEETISFRLKAKNPDEILTTDVSGDELSIIVNENNKKWFNFGSIFSHPKLEVYVPEQAFDKFNVRSNNGRITSEGLQAEDITVKTDNGRIDMENMTGTTVTVETNNGKIDLTNIVASNTTIAADNGKIDLNHVEGDIVGHADNGKITLKAEDIDRDIDLSTSNGKIYINTKNKPTNAVIDVQVGNGKARVFGESKWDTIIGNGDHLIKLRTSNGSITVE